MMNKAEKNKEENIFFIGVELEWPVADNEC